MSRHLRTVLFTSLALVVALAAPAADAGTTPPGPFDHLEWRNLGPANMGGRVADVAGVPGDPKVVWVGAAAGGVWKSSDAGTTFTPVFDHQPVASIGAIAVAPSNPSVVYVGTGESAARNSVSAGNGVYRTTDGGATWTHLGLDQTRHISKILVDPNDPDRIWVGALGHIYGPNSQRGVFRSSDGGATWDKVLFVDDHHGISDLAMDPTNPKLILAGVWRFERRPWSFTSGGEGGGVFRSTDGGATWTKVTKGLPKEMGRIGIAVARSNPEVVYVIAETNAGTLFRSSDGGSSFTRVSDEVEIVSRGFYYTHVRVDPTDENTVYAVASTLWRSIDGGHTFKRIARGTHIDYHALWIDPLDPNRLWQGQDGGIAVSHDRGDTWEAVRNLPIAQYYQVFADARQPFYFVGGGLQDNGCWTGPSRTREPAGILDDDWRMVSFGDGFYMVANAHDPDLYLSESQAGAIVRTDMRTRQQISVSPQPARNDGGPAKDLPVRFNWNAPIVASPHDPDTVYFAGSVVFKSTDFGLTWEAISPDLTTADPAKMGEAGGPVWPENTTAEYHCTVISFAESPAEAGVLWAGTDDGNLQLTRDGGVSWTNVVGRVPGLPHGTAVSHIEPSRSAPGTAWAAFDGHQLDDPAPRIYRTDDYGATWRNVSGDLPAGAFVWVVRQDPRVPGLLWAGTELGLYGSRDERHWQSMRLANLPTVPVHDLVVKEPENDLVLGTHGRGLWIFDDATALQQLDDPVRAEPVHLFPVRTALRFPARFTRYGLGAKVFKAPNPPTGAILTYWLKEGVEPEVDHTAEHSVDVKKKPTQDRLKIEIVAADGRHVRTLKKVPAKTGLNRTAWDLADDPPVIRKRDPEREEWQGPPHGPRVLPGTYTARVVLDGKTVAEQPLEVAVDPSLVVAPGALEAQRAAAVALNRASSDVNQAMKDLDAVVSQLDARRAAAKQLGDGECPRPSTRSSTEASKQVKELLGRMADRRQQADLGPGAEARRPAGGPLLGRRLRLLRPDVRAAGLPRPTRRRGPDDGVQGQQLPRRRDPGAERPARRRGRRCDHRPDAGTDVRW